MKLTLAVLFFLAALFSASISSPVPRTIFALSCGLVVLWLLVLDGREMKRKETKNSDHNRTAN